MPAHPCPPRLHLAPALKGSTFESLSPGQRQSLSDGLYAWIRDQFEELRAGRMLPDVLSENAATHVNGVRSNHASTLTRATRATLCL